ncbi:MAG: folate-binding protein YgfZ [Acidobacteria bacterium]|nr:folate-binding protein YgfZ [Acidobacteriota bacterium]
MNTDVYNCIRSGGSGFTELPRGLFAVWGKESVQFLDGLITNDVKTLGDGDEMLAAFPNAQGRLLALVRVLRQGERFLIETEEATREKLFQNLFRFTYAGDFFVEDLSEQYRYFAICADQSEPPALAGGFLPRAQSEPPVSAGGFLFSTGRSTAHFISVPMAADFRDQLLKNGSLELSEELYETIRIESGIPKFGVDMDENTIVPELGLDGLISYNKGCYIGQEIIARIHFRGHVAKQLTGLIFAAQAETRPVGSVPPSGLELATPDGKNAGRITSIAYSPERKRHIALAYVRYDHLQEGTKLMNGDLEVEVTKLPFN